MNKLQQINFELWDVIEPFRASKEKLQNERKQLIQEQIDAGNEHNKIKNQILTQEIKFIDGKIQGYLESLQLTEEIFNTYTYSQPAKVMLKNTMLQFEIPVIDVTMCKNNIYIDLNPKYFVFDGEISAELDINTVQNASFTLLEEDIVTNIIQLKTQLNKTNSGKYIGSDEDFVCEGEAALTIFLPHPIYPSQINKIIVNLGKEKIFILKDFKSKEISKPISPNKKDTMKITLWYTQENQLQVN